MAGRGLELHHGGQTDTTFLTAWYNLHLAQYQWFIENASSGYCRIRSLQGNRIPDGRWGEDKNVTNFTLDQGNPYQEWAFLPVKDQIRCLMFTFAGNQWAKEDFLVGTEISSVESPDGCAVRCLNETACFAFSYEPIAKSCRLASAVPDSEAFESQGGWNAYIIGY